MVLKLRIIRKYLQCTTEEQKSPKQQTSVWHNFMFPYKSAPVSGFLESFSWHGAETGLFCFRKKNIPELELRTRGIISPRWQRKSSFFKAEYETEWLVKWDFVCGGQTECEKKKKRGKRRGGGTTVWAGQEAAERNAALGCEECWYVAPTNIQSRRAADPLWNVCLCVWRRGWTHHPSSSRSSS